MKSLEEIAGRQFPDLSEAERRLLVAAPQGMPAFCGPTNDDNSPFNNAAIGRKWGKTREIRAKLLRWLCFDRE
jgi:hypothetical protein